MTFYEWALSAPIERNPRGDYCANLRTDARAAHVPNMRAAWEGYHLYSSPQVIMAFRSLWVSYENWLKRHGLQMPTAPIAEDYYAEVRAAVAGKPELAEQVRESIRNMTADELRQSAERCQPVEQMEMFR